MSQVGALTIVVGFLLLSFQNCGSSEEAALGRTTSNQNVSGDDIERRLESVRGLAAADLSCTAVADCEAVAVGSAPCGGPSDYLIVSSRNSSFEQIVTLAEQVSELQHRFNLQNDLAGTCQFLMPPNLVCSAGTCRVSGI